MTTPDLAASVRILPAAWTVEAWTEWAPSFFEYVALPVVPAPKLWPTYLDPVLA